MDACDNHERAGDIRVENAPDSQIKEPTDAIVRVTRVFIRRSDLWPYHLGRPEDGAQRMGHEAIRIVEDTGSDGRTVKKGDVDVMPFAA